MLTWNLSIQGVMFFFSWGWTLACHVKVKIETHPANDSSHFLTGALTTGGVPRRPGTDGWINVNVPLNNARTEFSLATLGWLSATFSLSLCLTIVSKHLWTRGRTCVDNLDTSQDEQVNMSWTTTVVGALCSPRSIRMRPAFFGWFLLWHRVVCQACTIGSTCIASVPRLDWWGRWSSTRVCCELINRLKLGNLHVDTGSMRRGTGLPWLLHWKFMWHDRVSSYSTTLSRLIRNLAEKNVAILH